MARIAMAGTFSRQGLSPSVLQPGTAPGVGWRIWAKPASSLPPAHRPASHCYLPASEGGSLPPLPRPRKGRGEATYVLRTYQASLPRPPLSQDSD